MTTEVSSALSLKVRTGALTPQRRQVSRAGYAQLLDRLLVLTVTTDHFHAAARYAEQQDLMLRAGDALHLAIAAAQGATLLTLDRRLYDAGLAVGVAAETV